MKTKNMRKKALVSSLAMLLVAVVALSGATFAWFTSNNAATVSELSLKASTTSSLLFTDKATPSTDDWTAQLDLGQKKNSIADYKVLVPVSSATGATFLKATADASKNGSGNTTVVSGFEGANSTDYYATTGLKVKSGSDAGIALKSITAGGLESAIRVAIQIGSASPVVYAAGSTLDSNAYVVTSSTAFDSTKGDVTYADLYKGTYSDDTTPIANLTNLKSPPTAGEGETQLLALRLPSTSTKIPTGVTVGTGAQAKQDVLVAGTAYTISITIWLEGNDPDCKDSMSLASCDNFKLEFVSV